MKNQFMLRLEYYDSFDNGDKAVWDVLTEQELEDSLWWQQVTRKEQEAIYIVKASMITMLTLKRNLDERIQYKSLELFEYRTW